MTPRVTKVGRVFGALTRVERIVAATRAAARGAAAGGRAAAARRSSTAASRAPTGTCRTSRCGSRSSARWRRRARARTWRSRPARCCRLRGSAARGSSRTRSRPALRRRSPGRRSSSCDRSWSRRGMIGGWLPQWVVEAILPLAFAVIAFRFVLRAGRRGASAEIALLGLLRDSASCCGSRPRKRRGCAGAGSRCCWWRCRSARRSSSLLGGVALVLFFTPTACRSPSMPVETYRVSCLADARRHPALHAHRLPARRGQASASAWCACSARCSAGCRAAPRSPRRWCARSSPLHRRLGRDDPRARRAADAGAGAQRVLPRGTSRSA